MPVRLIIVPHSDTDFGATADACLTDGAGDPDALATCLREAYPRVVVHDGVEVSGASLWYVYREGHWVDGD